jgi:hypothetical protein
LHAESIYYQCSALVTCRQVNLASPARRSQRIVLLAHDR